MKRLAKPYGIGSALISPEIVRAKMRRRPRICNEIVC
jgi:hypothetical protein